MRKRLIRNSRFLSLVLRHAPERIGLVLDDQGWASVDALLQAMAANGQPITRDGLDEIVETNEKRRFAFNEKGTHIRANQGHSIDVDLGLVPRRPPAVLFHGTAARNLDSVRRRGLERRARQHVHLSLDARTAIAVGQRHGQPVVISVRAGAMHDEGFVFYCSDNGVWLTETVPVAYLELPG